MLAASFLQIAPGNSPTPILATLFDCLTLLYIIFDGLLMEDKAIDENGHRLNRRWLRYRIKDKIRAAWNTDPLFTPQIDLRFEMPARGGGSTRMDHPASPRMG